MRIPGRVAPDESHRHEALQPAPHSLLARLATKLKFAVQAPKVHKSAGWIHSFLCPVAPDTGTTCRLVESSSLDQTRSPEVIELSAADPTALNRAILETPTFSISSVRPMFSSRGGLNTAAWCHPVWGGLAQILMDLFSRLLDTAFYAADLEL